MPTTLYKTATVQTIDGDSIFITPLKIKYMRQFMDEFSAIDITRSDIEVMEVLSRCCAIAMQQYAPSIKTPEDVEDSFDIDTIYTIIDVGAGITLKQPSAEQAIEQNTKTKANQGDGTSWDNLDLVKLESEAFLLGIWKDYDDLESSLCMQELSAILEAKRDQDYEEKKFLAAIQGVDLDAQTGKNDTNPWEEMKARVAAKMTGVDNNGANDITSFVGQRARNAGFGIGMGLDYEKQ